MKKSVVLVLSAVAVVNAVFGGEVAEQATVPCVWTNSVGGVFNYRYHAPASGGKHPLVLLLHGAGERGSNNVAQLKWGADDIVKWFADRGEDYHFVAGQVPSGKRWVEVDWGLPEHAMPKDPSEAMSNLIEVVEHLFASGTVDRSRVYVTGVSMGGYGTWDLLCRKPEWFAAGMPVCGGGDPHQAWRIRDIPIWTFHGDKDGAVPTCRSRKMTAALWAIDGKIRYRECYGFGHNVWTPAYADKEVLDWVFTQRRK